MRVAAGSRKTAHAASELPCRVSVIDLRQLINAAPVPAGRSQAQSPATERASGAVGAALDLHSSDKRQRALADAVAKAARAELAESKKATKPGRSGTQKARSRDDRSES